MITFEVSRWLNNRLRIVRNNYNHTEVENIINSAKSAKALEDVLHYETINMLHYKEVEKKRKLSKISFDLEFDYQE